MKENELLAIAIDLYHKEGKELDAIQAFKELLKDYPQNLDGWTHLSTIQNNIADFDGAIESINHAIKIDPNNSWTIQQKCTTLSLISKFSSEGQMYFNENTKEAYEIKSFNSKVDLFQDLNKSITKVIQLEEGNEKKKYDYSWKLANNKNKLGQFENAIEILTKLKKQIPKTISSSKKENEITKIENGITKNLIGLKKYEEVIKRLKKSLENQSDDYFIGIQLAEIYSEINDTNSEENTLQKVLQNNDKKLREKPELAFLSRKFEILKKLNRQDKMKEVISDFELIENQNEFTITRKNEIKKKINEYLAKHEEELATDNPEPSTNFEILPLTSAELDILKRKYEKRYAKFKSVSVVASLLGILALFTPPKIWNFIKYFDKKQSIRNLEDVNEYMFQNPTMVIIVILSVIAVGFFSHFIYIKPLKKDLNDKLKTRGKFKVIRIENISKRVSEKLDGLDTILHFEKNNSKIKKHLFKKADNPELIHAKEIVIEQSKHTGIIFSETIMD